MKIEKKNIIAASRIYFIGIFTVGVIYFILGISASIIGGLAGIQGYLVNSKGFYKKRILKRTILLILILNIAVLLAGISAKGNMFLLPLTFLFAASVTFFSLEEYLEGMMAHLPILLIYLLSFSGASIVNPINNLLGATIGVIVATLLGLILWPTDPNYNMKNSIENYLKKATEEIQMYSKMGFKNETRRETSIAYKGFLKEFYKSSSGSWLSSNYGRQLFEFALTLHNFMESIRSKSKYEELSSGKYLEISLFLENLIKSRFTDAKSSLPNKKLAHLLIQKRQELIKFSQSSNDNDYKHNKDFLLWIKGNLSLDSVRMRYALKMAIILTTGLYISSVYGLEKSIWLPVTMLTITQPYEKDSKNKFLNRLMGTLAGIGMVTIILPILTNDFQIMLVAILSIFPALIFMGINYAWAMSFITLNSILLSATLLPASLLYFQRGYYTILGGIIVIAVELLFSDRGNVTIKKRVIQLIEADILTLRGIINLYKGTENDHIDHLIMKSYLCRDILSKNINSLSLEENRKIMNISVVFIEKLIFLYSRVKNKKIPDGYLHELRVVEDILSEYHEILLGNQITLSIERLDDAIKSEPDDRSIREVLRLTKHFTEEVIPLYV